MNTLLILKENLSNNLVIQIKTDLLAALLQTKRKEQTNNQSK